MINSFNQQYKQLSIKFIKVSLREQVLILFCGVALVVLIMYTSLLEPLLESSKKLKLNGNSAEREITSLTGQVARLTGKLNIKPNDPVLERISVLQRQIESIDTQLGAQISSLIPANKMAGMLESVLTGSKRLKLVELRSIPPIPLMLKQTEADVEQKVGLYRHGVTLIFEGSYFDIQQHLEKLESLPWQFYWKKFDYLVGDYPTASVELEIYTLSTNKAFIGI
jgi:MSHA biogenesis protein MshJ